LKLVELKFLEKKYEAIIYQTLLINIYWKKNLKWGTLMINILINLSGKSHDIYNEYIKCNPQDANKEFHVYSPYEIKINEKVKLIKTPMNNCLATLMNNIF
jgi:hypothetical protein